MNAGQIISGVGHVGLIGWVLFGGVFRSAPEPFEVTEVSVVSAAEFEALLASDVAPAPATDVALPVEPAPIAPPAETPAPDSPPETAQPETPEPPVAESLPETPAPLPPQPVPEEVVPEPVPEVVPEETPVVDLLTAVVRPRARPVERIAPEPVVQPNPEVQPDVVEQPEVTPEVAEVPSEEEPQEATAPEEAAPEIVTEAEEDNNAPLASVRPPARRPSPPVRQAEEETTPEAPAEPEAAETDTGVGDAVNDALAEALAGAEEPVEVPTGPPLTQGERDDLILAVGRCWNVGSLSSEALETTVVVALTMNRDATPVVGSMRLASITGGSEAAARQAFEAARRAIIRCGANGYGLPDEKFGQWKEIEITFNPERMRNR